MYTSNNGQKLYEQVVSKIQESIASGVYKKGDMLPSEKELMDMTGVSRITVREAIRILKESGVIETRKGKGSFVLIDSERLAHNIPYDSEAIKSFLEATQVCYFIEPEVVKEVARKATMDDILSIREALNNTNKNPHSREEFHISIARVLHNKTLEQLYTQLQSVSLPASPIELVEPENQKTVANTISQQHTKIFEMIKDGNGDFAYFYMKEHIDYIYQIYEEYFRRFFSR